MLRKRMGKKVGRNKDREDGCMFPSGALMLLLILVFLFLLPLPFLPHTFGLHLGSLGKRRVLHSVTVSLFLL